MVLYTCPSCGAEIVAQETTASTYCCYCHNPVVLSGSLDGKYRPDGLIPFEIDKKKAKEIFKNWIQKKKYVPDDFYSPRQMEYLEGIYYPYWMYSCQVSGEMQAEALRKRVTVAGEPLPSGEKGGASYQGCGAQRVKAGGPQPCRDRASV